MVFSSSISDMATRDTLSRIPSLAGSMKRDKAIKVGYTLSALISVLNPNNRAASKTQTTFKIARDIFALGNVLGGVLNGIVDISTKVIPAILVSLKDKESVVKLDAKGKKWISKPESRTNLVRRSYGIIETKLREEDDGLKADVLDYYQAPFGFAATTAQKVTAFFEKIGELIGGVTYTIGFGTMRPISTINRNCGLECHKGAKGYASHFPLVMAINHIGGVVQHVFALLRNALTYSFWKERMAKFDQNESSQGKTLYIRKWRVKYNELEVRTVSGIQAPSSVVRTRVQRVYAQSMVKSSLSLAEKSIEVVVDVNTWAKVLGKRKILPSVAAVSLTFVASIAGLASAWFSTYKEPKVGE